ncbi:hypothetical protein Cgig2_006268 [Carnegiea gigantea]|uniref:Uncharacterized protein n=1 Tax=Carnegiea gigantea TaxID=171969 RepID=A0A9Q1K118_9CARY|nr:hypothetical protein Cgig2_006268 [Carnegiea gigantea]
MVQAEADTGSHSKRKTRRRHRSPKLRVPTTCPHLGATFASYIAFRQLHKTPPEHNPHKAEGAQNQCSHQSRRASRDLRNPKQESAQSYHRHREKRGIKGRKEGDTRSLSSFVFRIHDKLNNQEMSASIKRLAFRKASHHLLCHLITVHHLNTSQAHLKEAPPT